jgi:CheY-like chemotaxis protein
MSKLLLVDDEEDALTWMTAALQSRGHVVEGFHDAQSALDGLRTFAPDLIISDILMPEIDGLAFARLARQRTNVPVLFVSIAKKQAEAVLAGGVGYLEKPASAAELRTAVERILGRSQKSTVLIADDDEDMRNLYRAYLEPRFSVIAAENGRVALDVLRSEHVDLAIIDVHMPIMNGVDLIRAMRRDPVLERVPIIVQTNDRAALKAPIWGALHVAQVMGKESFLGWLESNTPPS